MKRLNCIFLISLVFILLASCSKEEIQSDTLIPTDDNNYKDAKANKFKPFKASFEVYVDAILQPPPNKIQEVLGTGNATHLGLTELYMKQWWSPVAPGIGTGHGELIFTAANGDKLLADYVDGSGVHKPSHVEITFTGMFKDGGTGKFTKAQGSFTWEGIYYPPPINEGSSTLKGQIKYSKK